MTAAPASMTPPPSPPQGSVLAAQPQFSPGSFGDALILSVAFGAAGDILALPRPPLGVRTLLIIVNDLPASAIRVNMDSPATATAGIAIQPLGNLLLDAVVPQNDIHIFSPIAGVVTVMYINADVTNPAKILEAV